MLIAYPVPAWGEHVFKVGAMNCGVSKNADICREYEIIGYPMVKFFPPRTQPGDFGMLDGQVGTGPELETAMAEWVERMQTIPDYKNDFSNTPDLTSLKQVLFIFIQKKLYVLLKGINFRTTDPDEIWQTHVKRLQSAKHALLIIDHDTTFSMGELILEMFGATKDLPDQVIVRKFSLVPKTFKEGIAKPEKNMEERVNRHKLVHELLRNAGVPTDGVMVPYLVAFERRSKPRVIVQKAIETDQDLLIELKNRMYAYYDLTVSKNTTKLQSKDVKSRKLGGKYHGSIMEQLKRREEQNRHLRIMEMQDRAVVDGKKILKRRYTAYFNDIEMAIEYAIALEATKRKYIKDEALQAFKDFLDLLYKYFPREVRPTTHEFLKQMRRFVEEEGEFGIRGDYMAWKCKDLKTQTRAFSRARPNPTLLGCRGTEPHYGGFNCALWTLFHYLSVREHELNHQNAKPVVIKVMADFIGYFFGCRDCADHFKTVVEEGKGLEIEYTSDAVLWLWWAHNKVNVRLQYDVFRSLWTTKAAY